MSIVFEFNLRLNLANSQQLNTVFKQINKESDISTVKCIWVSGLDPQKQSWRQSAIQTFPHSLPPVLSVSLNECLTLFKKDLYAPQWNIYVPAIFK